MLPASLKRYAWLSIAAALATILLKSWAWWITGSVGMLSDALESFVNLAGAIMALAMLTLAAMPADDNHAHGHGKAEYFSSAFEGFPIIIAAVAISYAAIDRLLNPQLLKAVGIGREGRPRLPDEQIKQAAHGPSHCAHSYESGWGDSRFQEDRAD